MIFIRNKTQVKLALVLFSLSKRHQIFARKIKYLQKIVRNKKN